VPSDEPQHLPPIEGPTLRMPSIQEDVPYPDVEDHRSRELLRANGIGLSCPELAEALRADLEVLRAAAAHTLGANGCSDAVAELRAVARGRDDLARAEAGYALARLGDAEGEGVLRACLALPPDAYVGAPVAAGYLARLGDPAGFESVQRALGVPLTPVRVLACKQLWFFVPFHEQAIDVFAEYRRALQDDDPGVRWQALVQLRDLEHPEARALLEAYARDGNDESLRAAAAAALTRNEAAG
jgi:HEAT repeats